MSRHSHFDFFQSGRLVPTRETMFDYINWRANRSDLIFNALSAGYELGLDYDVLTSDEDEDDFSNSHQNRYCGFPQNFLERKHLPSTSFRGVKSITQEEAEINAKKLVDEEEKLKKKAEKKKQKKMRQRERRRLEKLEKENADKASDDQDNPDPVETKVAEKESENKNKTSNKAPPDPGPHSTSVASESSESDEEEEDDRESVGDEPEELDMNSWFVTNAAAIAKRKQKLKHDRKDKKAENFKKHVPEEKETEDSWNEYTSQAASGDVSSEEKVKDPVTKSTELAVIGNTYAQSGKLEMAVMYFTQAIKHNPQEFKLFGNRSFCYEKMQQYEKALTDADIALSLNPTWIKGLYRKGRALVGLKKYYEAGLTYKEVLKLDSSCRDAAHELFRVNIMQLMDMGYTREQSSNSLIIHGTLEKALEVLSELHGNMAPPHPPREENVCPELKTQPLKAPLQTVSQNQHRVSAGPTPALPEFFPIWVGDLVPALSESKLHELFRPFGSVYSVKLLSGKRCAFVNYTRKEDCEKAINNLNGYHVAGTCLTVRYPDRIHTHLGASKTASTDIGVPNKLPDECFFWRTTGCIKNNRCPYKHVPENKGVDRPKAK
ncbi:tetratricopeptide repeat protein 31 isoform X2 [Trichomycterus rosablanca]|uniref:tetratricopeptide repeat protein 31 isoform X2 n=1 Tax=Trichomycterus rosablanca TaxID=2290929 RepID=UPI002F35540F